MNIVHVVGTGTIGEPLIGLLCDMKRFLGIDEVTFNKHTPRLVDRPMIEGLINRGAKLCVDADKISEFKDLGLEPSYMSETAIRRATVVVDCTPKGIGHANKMKYYTMYENEVTGFIAQGSESEFGKPFAFGINEKAITPDDKYIQVVSCNTHNIAVVIKAFHPGNLVAGRFVCIRRANDISQITRFIPGVEVGEHTCSLGTHQALDVRELYRTIGYDLNVWSSAMKVSTQYMHSIHFILTLAYAINEEEAIETFRNQPRVAVTNKMNSCEVFSFGRDHGHYGRILSQTIVVLPTIRVIDEHEVVGFCFTPQDGNSLLSSVVALERFLYPDQYLERIKCLDYFLFDEV